MWLAGAVKTSNRILRNVVSPSIAGDPAVGQTLIGILGEVAGSPPPVLSQAWLRGTTMLTPAIDYLVTSEDAGQLLTFRRVATSGLNTLTTDVSITIAAASSTSMVMSYGPSIGGKAEVKRALIAKAGLWSHTPTKKWPWPQIGGRWWKNGVATDKTDEVWLADDDVVGDRFMWQELVINHEGLASVFSDEITLAAYSATDIQASTLGCKPLKTTGSISADNLSLLIVEDGSEFTTGASIVIEIGGEAGAGARMTMGVGGAWPPLSYPNLAAMEADTSQSTGTKAWLLDEGAVLTWSGSGWISASEYDYYYGYSYPLSHVTTITKSGNNFTLATPVKVPTTNATIWLNNAKNYNSENQTIIYGPGEFGLGAATNISNNNSDVTIQGAGDDTTFVIPKGLGIAGFWSNGGSTSGPSRRIRLRDCRIKGNAGLDGYAFAFANSKANGVPGPAYMFEATGECVASNVRVDECFSGPSNSRAKDTWGVNISVRLQAPTLRYFQWIINGSDCTRGGYIDASLDSDWMVSGIEFFRCFQPKFTRIVSRNGVFSTNTSGYFQFVSPRIHIEANKRYPMDWTEAQAGPFLVNYSTGKPYVDMNGNIGNASGDGLDNLQYGGHVIDMQLTIDGPLDSSGAYPNLVVCAPNYILPDGVNPSVAIHGKDGGKGFIKMPDKATGDGRWGVLSDGVMSVWDMIITGKPPASYGRNVQMNGAGLVQDCVLWAAATGGGGVVSGNVTPDEFVTAGGTLP